MKVIMHIDENTNEEKVEITAREVRSPIQKIIDICNNEENYRNEIVGFDNDAIFIIPLTEIVYFNICDKKLYVNTLKKQFFVKKRLYEIEEMLKDNIDFIKISQSVIINLKQVLKFELVFNGNIVCVLKNGDREYVSRRSIATLKQRLGI